MIIDNKEVSLHEFSEKLINILKGLIKMAEEAAAMKVLLLVT